MSGLGLGGLTLLVKMWIPIGNNYERVIDDWLHAILVDIQTSGPNF